MELQERIYLLEEAAEELEQVIEKVYQALRGTSHESHADAYILGHLRGWVESDNRFNSGIRDYMEQLESGEIKEI